MRFYSLGETKLFIMIPEGRKWKRDERPYAAAAVQPQPDGGAAGRNRGLITALDDEDSAWKVCAKVNATIAACGTLISRCSEVSTALGETRP